ncbi:MAG TPA: efflux transporter outer membrane subunit [Candidatus Deferrimicrobiaceae bacterium]
MIRGDKCGRAAKGRQRLAMAGALALLSACATVGPNYVRPEAPTPSAFKSPDAWKDTGEWKLASPGDNVLRGPWWEIYGDPGLNALEAQVVIANQDVAAAEARYRQAQTLVTIARSGEMPTVTAGASITGGQRSREVAGGGSRTTDYLLPISASWEPDLWGKIRRAVESGTAGVQASRADVEAITLSARAELAQDYFQMRALDAQKKILDETIEAYRKSLVLTQNRYEAGVAAKSEVLQADTQLRTIQAQVIDTRVARAQFEHAIALLVGKPPSVVSLADAPLDAVPPPVPAGLPSALLERRPDIAGDERRMAAANAQIGVAEAAYYPTVRLGAGTGLEALSLAKWLTWPARFWSLGPSISEVVFNGDLRKAQTASARAAYDGTVAAYRQTVLSAFKEVEDALSALRILEAEAKTQDLAVRSAEQSVEMAINQYKAGTVSYLNVIIAQATALGNRRTALDIQGRRMVASVQLIRALGGGWNASSLKDAPAGTP